MKRKKRKEIPMPDPFKSKSGGARSNAGRKSFGDKPMSAGIFIRCTEEQKAALSKFVTCLSEEREANGQSKLNLSTWLRELGLKHSGNEDLCLVEKFGGIV